MAEPILEARNLVQRFGAVVATDDLSLNLLPGELHAVIGPNGAGKTTLVTLPAGEMRPTTGAIFLSGEDITGRPVPVRSQKGIARSFQTTSLCPEFSALENVVLAVQAHQGPSFRMVGPVAMLTIAADQRSAASYGGAKPSSARSHQSKFTGACA
jgi:branched-chain amino acid transport system ATP-binding protein